MVVTLITKAHIFIVYCVVLDFAHKELTDTGMALFIAVVVYSQIYRNIEIDTIF